MFVRYSGGIGRSVLVGRCGSLFGKLGSYFFLLFF